MKTIWYYILEHQKRWKRRGRKKDVNSTNRFEPMSRKKMGDYKHMGGPCLQNLILFHVNHQTKVMSQFPFQCIADLCLMIRLESRYALHDFSPHMSWPKVRLLSAFCAFSSVTWLQLSRGMLTLNQHYAQWIFQSTRLIKRCDIYMRCLANNQIWVIKPLIILSH